LAISDQNDGVDVGTVRIIGSTPPFNLTLDVPAPDAPELTFVKGKRASFRLKNSDSQEYSISWDYSVNGKVIRSSDPCVPTMQNRTTSAGFGVCFAEARTLMQLQQRGHPSGLKLL